MGVLRNVMSLRASCGVLLDARAATWAGACACWIGALYAAFALLSGTRLTLRRPRFGTEAAKAPARSSQECAESGGLDWATIAPGHADHPHQLSGKMALGQHEAASVAEQTMEQVFELLASPVFMGEGPPLHLLTPTDADWSGFAGWMHARVKAINMTKGVPRMRVVHWKTLRGLGRIPRWPDDASAIIDLEDLLEAWQKRQDDKGKIGDRILCLSMFSHRWSRPSLDRDAAHPDTEDGLKARSLAEYGRGGTCSVFPNHKFDYFFWIE